MPKRKSNSNPERIPADETRAWQPREMRMASQYLASFFPRALTMTRVRLGSLPYSELTPLLDDHEVRMMSVFRRWADALAITEDTIYLIEVKIRPDPGVISQLQLYRRLLPHTPEIQAYITKRIEMQLVYAIEDPVVLVMAREAGIRPIYFRPKYIEDYIKQLFPRHRRAPKLGIP